LTQENEDGEHHQTNTGSETVHKIPPEEGENYIGETIHSVQEAELGLE